MARLSLAGFAAALTAFALSSTPWIGFPAVFLCGATYFVLVTALLTTLQLRVTTTCGDVSWVCG